MKCCRLTADSTFFPCTSALYPSIICRQIFGIKSADYTWVITVGPVHVCTTFEINRYKIDKFGRLCSIWRHVMQKRYVLHHSILEYTSDRYFDQEHFEINQKFLRLPVQKLWLKQWFSCSGDLDCSIVVTRTRLYFFYFIEYFRTTFLCAHSWLNWVDDDEHDEVGLKEKPEETRYIKKITSK